MNSDTLYNQIQDLNNFVQTNEQHNDGIEALLGAFVIPFILLLIVSYAKYFMATSVKTKEILHFFIELPIDLYTIAITTVLTFYYRLNTINSMIYLLFASIFLVLLCSTIRRYGMSLLNKDNFPLLKIIVIFLLEWGVSLGSMYFIICKMGIR